MNAQEFNNKILPLKDKVFRFLLRLTGDRMEAEDALQDVFAKLWVKREHLTGKEYLDAYVMRIAKNHFLDMIRSAQAKRQEKTVNLEYVDIERFPSEQKQRHHEEAYQLIMKIVDDFDEDQKMMFQMREVEGMKIDEICQIIGKKSNAVRTALSRMRKKIREELIERYDYEQV